MIPTMQNQSAWHRQPHNKTHHLRLVSPGDVTYALASLFLSSMQLVPAAQRIRMIDKASRLLARLLYAANVFSTQTIRQNLNAVLGPSSPPEMLERAVQRLLSMTIWNSLIINSLPMLSKEQIVSLASMDGISCLDDYLASDRPVLIWSYHFGVHPVIVAAILYARGYPIHAIAHARQMPVAASVFQRFYLRRLGRISNQFPVIDPREGPQHTMLDVLRNKECLYITPDYMITVDETKPKSAFEVSIDFLERETCLQTGGLRLAKRFKAQVVTVLSAPVNGNERRLIVEPFEFPTPGLTPSELQQDLQMCMNRFEAHVLTHPHLWLDSKRDDLLKRLNSTSHNEPVGMGNSKG
ncbi:MAG: hypothetical protein SWK90_10935 [Chloroflexota bacterium]|nr:hypothetical protein [Chloroflexota bacterium]